MKRVAKQTTIVALIALVALALSACNRNAGGTSSTPNTDTAVAAVVNGKNITLKEVDTYINQQYQGQQSQMSPLEMATTRLQALQALIQSEVLLQRAEKENLKPTEDEISAYISNSKQQSGMTEEQFQSKLKEQGMTVEGLKEETRKVITIQKLQDKFTSKVAVPSDKEVQDFYESNKSQFVNARGVALAAIIVDPGDNSSQGILNDAKSEAEAKQKIDLIYQQLKNGADFASVARDKTEDIQSMRQSGDIGFATEDDLKRNNFPQSLVDQFFGPMQVGSYTAPVNFNNRWYIFKLQRKQLQAENLTMDNPSVRQQITEAITNQRKQIVIQALVADALAEAKITNNLAKDMLNSPNNLSGLRPAANPSATPAASPASSPKVTVSQSPQQSASPAAAKASPKASPAAKR